MKPTLLLWCARLAWAVLPATAGGAIADALDGWSTGAALLATVLLWTTWAAGLLALLALRPWGLTLLRVIAPVAVGCAILSITSTSVASAATAVTTSFLAATLALSDPVAAAAGNALAYGDEVRFPMRIPTPLLLGPVPLAIAVVAAGAVAGPLLLADGRVIAGVVCTIAGLPVAWLVVRSLDALSRRWVVVVPAGVAIVDPLTLLEPVLVRRDVTRRVQRVPGRSLPPGVLDLRLGTLVGGVEISLEPAVTFGRRRGRVDADLVDADGVAVAITRPDAFLALAAKRRLPIR